MDYRSVAEKNLILKVKVGSHLYGTNTPQSDLDYDGVFMPDRAMVFGLGSCREVELGVEDKDLSGRNTKDAVDFKAREYRDFVKLAVANNPNILNMLFANRDCVEFSDEFGDRLLGMAKEFVYDGCRHKYASYAKSQMMKMKIKPENYKDIVGAIKYLESLEEEYSHEMIASVLRERDLRGSGLVDKGPGKHVEVAKVCIPRSTTVKKTISLLRKKEESASYRKRLWSQFGYDTKHAGSLIQILLVGEELARTGEVGFPLAERELVKAVKTGSLGLDEVIRIGEDRIDRLKTMSSVLRKKLDFDKINKFVENEVEQWFWKGREV